MEEKDELFGTEGNKVVFSELVMVAVEEFEVVVLVLLYEQ